MRRCPESSSPVAGPRVFTTRGLAAAATASPNTYQGGVIGGTNGGHATVHWQGSHNGSATLHWHN